MLIPAKTSELRPQEVRPQGLSLSIGEAFCNEGDKIVTRTTRKLASQDSK